MSGRALEPSGATMASLIGKIEGGLVATTSSNLNGVHSGEHKLVLKMQQSMN